VDSQVDVGRALQLKIEQGLTYQEIADIMGTCKQAVHKRLKPFLRLLDDPDAVRAYGKNEATLLDGARMELLANIVDPERLSKADPGRLAFAFDKLFHAGRLLRNQSTSNLGLRTIVVREALDALDGALPDQSTDGGTQGAARQAHHDDNPLHARGSRYTLPPSDHGPQLGCAS
jgi:hypothetical protein